MIRDGKGRKWYLRFRQYREGWHWDAQHGGHWVEADIMFETKALAEAGARIAIQDRDVIAMDREYGRRLCVRGTHCRLTAEDMEAIAAAGMI